MLNERELHYVEVDDGAQEPPRSEPRVRAILSLIFGIVSIILRGVVGVVLGTLARRFASPILVDFEGTVSSRLARAGRITGTVGLILSIIDLVLAFAFVAIVAVIVAIVVSNLKL